MRYTDQEVETKLNASVIQLLIHQIEPMDRNIHSCHLNPDFPEDITHLPVTQMSNEGHLGFCHSLLKKSDLLHRIHETRSDETEMQKADK